MKKSDGCPNYEKILIVISQIYLPEKVDEEKKQCTLATYIVFPNFQYDQITIQLSFLHGRVLGMAHAYTMTKPIYIT